jgi:ferredoxin
MTVSVDEGRCISAGHCVLVAPEVFDQREEDGVVVLLTSEPSMDLEDPVHEAERICPARAIEVSAT